jgi:hypothetical protein
LLHLCRPFPHSPALHCPLPVHLCYLPLLLPVLHMQLQTLNRLAAQLPASKVVNCITGTPSGAAAV